MPLPEHKTKRLTLRPLLPSSKTTTDLTDLYALRTQPSVMRWTRLGQVDTSPSDTKAWIDDCLALSTRISYLIQLDEAEAGATRPVVIGTIGAPRVPEVGYLLHPDYHGRGYATEALQGFLEVFWKAVPSGGNVLVEAGEAGYDYAHANVDSDNPGSVAVLKKCGFTFWGSAKSNVCAALGPDRTDLYYRLARPGTRLDAPLKPTSAAGVV